MECSVSYLLRFYLSGCKIITYSNALKVTFDEITPVFRRDSEKKSYLCTQYVFYDDDIAVVPRERTGASLAGDA